MSDSAMPVRIQLSRRKGWKMPPNTVSVARPGHWGNRYALGMPAPSWMGIPVLDTIERVVEAHRNMVLTLPGKVCEVRTFLHGKNLACWCPIISHGAYVPCHADVLLSIANDIPLEEVIRENTRRAEGQAL